MGCVPHFINAREMLAIVWVLRCAWRMGQTLSMSARREVTKKHPAEYGQEGEGCDLAPVGGYDGLVEGEREACVNGRQIAEGSGQGGETHPSKPHVWV